MKKLLLSLLVFTLLGISSCSNTTKDKPKKNTENEVGLNTCEEFLAHYEEWIDLYLEVINDYFNNPSDEISANRYMELMQEGLEWSTKWEKLVECADDEKYKQRFEEISKEVENKLEGLGL
jgi:hypothetical protein